MKLVLYTFGTLATCFIGYIAIYSLNKPSLYEPTSRIIVAPGFKE